MAEVSAPLPVPPGPSKPPSRGWAVALTILVGLWTVGVVVVVNAALWLVGDTLVISGLSMPLPFWLLGAALTTLLTGVPALLLSLLSRMWFARLAGRQWLLLTLFGGLLGAARLIPNTYHELYLAVLAIAAAIVAAVHRAVTGRREHADGWLFWLSLAVGLLMLLPWLWVGSFGGQLETVLALLAALAVSWLATRPLSALAAIAVHFRNNWVGAIVGGLVIGVGLAALAAGVGLPAVQLLALLAVPPVAFALAALHRKGRPSIVALLTPAIFGPLGMIDPDETSLILGLRDALFWGLVGAVATLGVALVVAVVVLVALRRARWHVWAAGVTAAVVAIGGAVIYAAVGQPGFAGERLFVVMQEQADLSGLSGVGDRTARVRQTYQRLVGTAERSQAPLRKALRDKGLKFTPFYLVNGVEVDAGPVVRQWLESRSDVAKVLLNPRLRPLPAQAPPMRGTVDAPTSPQWNLTLIGADAVWQRFGTGEGIVVGSSDSGVDGTHPALRGNFRGGDDSWLDPYGGGATPTDNNGHGTHTLATAVGAKVGVAPGAQWIACENLPRNLGSMANYLTCLQFMLAPYPSGADPWHAGRPERAPQVLTNSWGCPSVEGCDLLSLRPAVDAFAAAGIFFVAAAGNTGPRCETITDPPSLYPSTFTIGAVDRVSEVASFSSRGPTPDGLTKPNLMAPGVNVLSALPGGRYGYLSGTSMATPHVAGVVALMWSANPALIGNIEETRSILERTARPAQPSGKSCGTPADVVGAGLVDAFAAVAAAAPRPAS
ncbi:S8 family serine peptidase [Dactylosporangium fulvum]|uniref:S8 family serine peptidase n=1 Tax=Dactylosporangium fulvum TaxID=53359 RepID=A0ABY5W0A2_9ACTN|nr:S8 family serine peptidase [Dactylosporangium fulvum]UWP83350.1 S8 family serine peptidase [Dactylosporangium fulvum]